MSWVIIFALMIYCVIAYNQGYDKGFKDGKRYALFIMKGDIKK